MSRTQLNQAPAGFYRDGSGELMPESLRGKKLRLLQRGNFGRPQCPRFENPVMAGVEDVVNQPLYDSFTVAAATQFPNVTTLFQTPIGGAKTLAQTNMTKNGVLEAPQRAFVQAYRIYVQNDANPTDLINFLTKTSVTLTIGKKPYFEGPAFLLSAGGGAVSYGVAQLGTAPAGSSPVGLTSNGHPDQRSIFSLTQPYMIEQGEGFSVTSRAETGFSTVAAASLPAGTGLNIYFILDTELYRGVQ